MVNLGKWAHPATPGFDSPLSDVRLVSCLALYEGIMKMVYLTVQVIDVLHPGRANVSKVCSSWK
jgi:hypothetical protein